MKVLDKIISDAKVSSRKVLLVPVATIRHTPYNPKSRTSEGKRLAELVETVRKFGLQYPILITDDRMVVDGNRRLAACRTLGHEFIECIVSDASIDADELFSAINTSALNMAGKGWLEVARGGGKLPQREAALYDELHKRIGSYGIDLLIQQKLGLNILPLCKMVVAQGLTLRVEEVVMRVAMNKLTNKVNAIIRSDAAQAEKVAKLNALLES